MQDKTLQDNLDKTMTDKIAGQDIAEQDIDGKI